MKKFCTLFFFTLCVFCMSMAVVSADTTASADSFERGKKLLKQGELQPALEAFAAAAKADETNQAYKVQYMQTRQAVMLRDRMESEQDHAKWLRIASFLHAFYHKNDCFRAALVIDREVHAKEQSALSCLMLAETQLAMKQNTDAAKTLASLPTEAKKTDLAWAIDAFHAIALARDGKADEAKKVAATITVPDKLKSNRAFLMAGVKAIEGKNDAAIAMLTKAFETTPPSRLAALKEEAKTCPELASLVSTDAFVAAMKIESKVPESSCSGGSSCANCPNRGKCAGSGGSESETPKSK